MVSFNISLYCAICWAIGSDADVVLGAGDEALAVDFSDNVGVEIDDVAEPPLIGWLAVGCDVVGPDVMSLKLDGAAWLAIGLETESDIAYLPPFAPS